MPERDPRNYILGHSAHELSRLEAQALMIEPMTRRFFLAAGLAPGMRVLDVGSGAGDVAFLAANIVGPTGTVVGVDRAPAAIVTARERAAARGLGNVSFVESELMDALFAEPFDAVVGRYVLMFQRDPTTLVRRLIEHTRPGSIVVFHEVDWIGAQSSPPAPIFDAGCRWLIETLQRSGGEAHMGARLYATFVAAGLPGPEMDLGAQIGGGENSGAAVDLVADLIGTVVPDMEHLGIATAAEIAYETLSSRMLAEVIANGSIVIGRSEIGAWSRV